MATVGSFRFQEYTQQTKAVNADAEQSLIRAPQLAAKLEEKLAEASADLVGVTSQLALPSTTASQRFELAVKQKRLLEQRALANATLENFYVQQTTNFQRQQETQELTTTPGVPNTTNVWGLKTQELAKAQEEAAPQLAVIAQVNKAILKTPSQPRPNLPDSANGSVVRLHLQQEKPDLEQKLMLLEKANKTIDAVNKNFQSTATKVTRGAGIRFGVFADAILFKDWASQEVEVEHMLAEEPLSAFGSSADIATIASSDAFQKLQMAMATVLQKRDAVLLLEVKRGDQKTAFSELSTAIEDAKTKLMPDLPTPLPVVATQTSKPLPSLIGTNLQKAFVGIIHEFSELNKKVTQALPIVRDLSERVESIYFCKDLHDVSKLLMAAGGIQVTCPKANPDLLVAQNNAKTALKSLLNQRQIYAIANDKCVEVIGVESAQRAAQTRESFVLLSALIDSDTLGEGPECGPNKAIFGNIVGFWELRIKNMHSIATNLEAPLGQDFKALDAKMQELSPQVQRWQSSLLAKDMCEPAFDKQRALSELREFIAEFDTLQIGAGGGTLLHPASQLFASLSAAYEQSRLEAEQRMKIRRDLCAKLPTLAASQILSTQREFCKQDKLRYDRVVAEANNVLSQLPFWIDSQNAAENDALEAIIRSNPTKVAAVPATPVITPATPVITPATPVITPATSVITPAIEAAPAITKAVPAITETTPAAPEAPGGPPEAPGGPPEAPGGPPEAPGGPPEAPGGPPEEPGGPPEAPGGPPEATKPPATRGDLLSQIQAGKELKKVNAPPKTEAQPAEEKKKEPPQGDMMAALKAKMTALTKSEPKPSAEPATKTAEEAEFDEETEGEKTQREEAAKLEAQKRALEAKDREAASKATAEAEKAQIQERRRIAQEKKVAENQKREEAAAQAAKQQEEILLKAGSKARMAALTKSEPKPSAEPATKTAEEAEFDEETEGEKTQREEAAKLEAQKRALEAKDREAASKATAEAEKAQIQERRRIAQEKKVAENQKREEAAAQAAKQQEEILKRTLKKVTSTT